MRRVAKKPEPSWVLRLAASGAVGVHPGLVVRVRPATAFERATWAECPPDGLRVLIDEDGAAPLNVELGSALPQAGFVGLRDWRRLLREALRGAS